MDRVNHTVEWQRIMRAMMWLDAQVRLEPFEFAEDHLRRIAAELETLVAKVDAGEL